MKKAFLVVAGAALAVLMAAGPAMAQKKTLAVVVKGLDNPFFTVLGDGCAKWNKENPNSEYTCLYTGPASSADEAGEVQIVEDLINKGVAGIAISPSNAPAMANMLKAKNPKMPIMTIDADLKCDGRVVAGDPSFQGWRAQIDGKRVRMRKNHWRPRDVQRVSHGIRAHMG